MTLHLSLPARTASSSCDFDNTRSAKPEEELTMPNTVRLHRVLAMASPDLAHAQRRATPSSLEPWHRRTG